MKDWSDLWIAVAAGCWLGAAQPGDVLEIVSNDRAFDAVGDAAAARGVVYHRLLHKRGSQAAASSAADEEEPPKRRALARRPPTARSRHRRPRIPARAHHAAAAVERARTRSGAHRAAQAGAPRARIRHCTTIEAHGATRDQIVSVIGRLSGSDPTRWINLDVLEKALKSEGFARPPGSPRLVTRLRMFKDVEVDSHGRARLVVAPDEPAEPEAEAEAAPAAKAAPKKRRRRRKASSNGDAGESVSAETAPMAAAPYAEPPAE